MDDLQIGRMINGEYFANKDLKKKRPQLLLLISTVSMIYKSVCYTQKFKRCHKAMEKMFRKKSSNPAEGQ